MIMNYYALRFILDNRHAFWSNGAAGAGDNSTDPNPVNDPNDYLQPLAGNKFYKIIAVLAVIGLTIAVVVMASKTKSQ